MMKIVTCLKVDLFACLSFLARQPSQFAFAVFQFTGRTIRVFFIFELEVKARYSVHYFETKYSTAIPAILLIL